jgi:glycosyltransferase involved in cell wall biosynthesis
MKRISIVTPCYNEEENVGLLYEKVKEVMGKLENYSYEHIFIDNASEDKTVAILKEIAARDKKVKIIINARNFGHIRSPYYALLQATGDAVILIVADLQDPPELIPIFIKKWEEGYKIAIGVKTNSEEAAIFFAIRKMYYNLVSKLSEIKLVKNFTGFGLYDKKVIEILRTLHDPYPYFRGLICDIGFERAEIPYIQPVRKRGFTKNNFYSLYDIGMLGITNHSRVPLRVAAMLGFAMAMLSLLVALGYFVYKLIYWSSFDLGMAPIVIGFFFFASVQLFFLGIMGEYIGSIHTKVLKRPLVIEKERVNFEEESDTN